MLCLDTCLASQLGLAQQTHLVTPALPQTGSLLTVANLGDSRACLDTGKAVAQLTVDHRVATHKGERRRLQAQKVHIAPIGLDGEPALHSPLAALSVLACLSAAIRLGGRQAV